MNNYKDDIKRSYPVWSQLLNAQSLIGSAIIAGGAAGDLTVTGIKKEDEIVSVAAGGNNAQTVVDGGAAGDITVTGITTDDVLLSVLNITDGADLTSEFSITAADTINNTGGTATTGKSLLVLYATPSSELSSEFTVTDDDTINNAGGTATTGKDLVITWLQWGKR